MKDLWKAAENACLNSPYDTYKIGAAARIGKRVITAYNAPKGHPLQKKFTTPERKAWSPKYDQNPYLHAEIALLVATKGAIDEIFIFRYDRLGRIAMCRPCAGCMMALRAFGVKKIHYTTPDGFCTENINDSL